MRNRSYGFEIYLVNVKTIRQITQNFVAFSEKLNFKTKLSLFEIKLSLDKSHNFESFEFLSVSLSQFKSSQLIHVTQESKTHGDNLELSNQLCLLSLP